MTTARHLGTARRVLLALLGLIVTAGSVSAVPPTLNSSGLTPEQCYRRDSDCTQMCGEVTGDMRYECFSICDRMLDRCLDTGDWTDSRKVDPATGTSPGMKGELSSLFVRALMILSDTDKDGVLSAKEIQAMKDRVFEKVDTSRDQKSQSGSTPERH